MIVQPSECPLLGQNCPGLYGLPATDTGCGQLGKHVLLGNFLFAAEGDPEDIEIQGLSLTTVPSVRQQVIPRGSLGGAPLCLPQKVTITFLPCFKCC